MPKMLLCVVPLLVMAPLEPAAWRAMKGWKMALGLPAGVLVAGMSVLGHKVSGFGGWVMLGADCE